MHENLAAVNSPIALGGLRGNGVAKTIMAYLRFLFECAKRSIPQAWGTANNLGGALISVVCGQVANHFWPSLVADSPLLTPIIFTLIAWAILLILWAVFIAPFKIHREQQTQILGLGKVDARDLERMLGGKFLYNTFMAGNDGYLCAQYSGRSDLLHLNERPTKISVRAPKHSVAGIYFQFMNGHPPPGKKCRFYYIDPNGSEALMENIYSEQRIMLDAQGCFEFKLSIDEGYDLNEHASIQVLLRNWTK